VNRLRVLQFEDAAVDRLLVAENLAAAIGARFELTQVHRLADGLAALAAGAPDAILLDLGLPDCQGADTFARVHALAPGTPILVLTGLNDEALGAQLVKAGAQDYLPKSEMSGGMLARAIRYAIERKQMQEALRRLAWHDALTGLPNRNLLTDRMRQLIALAGRNGDRVAVLFVDLDGFKAVNDTLGHDAGDTVLKEVAQRLQAVLRRSDTVARLGGDEFVIAAPEIDTRADAARIAEKVLGVLREPIAVGEQRCAIGASIGIGMYPDHGGNADELLGAADAAMYRVKRGGRDGYEFYAADCAAAA
jgi:diguanylate cyclase (GGDEF)-like protein